MDKQQLFYKMTSVTPTLSSQPPTARKSPLGCQATERIPKPGSGLGENVPCTTPASERMLILYWMTASVPEQVLVDLVAHLQNALPYRNMVSRG